MWIDSQPITTTTCQYEKSCKVLISDIPIEHEPGEIIMALNKVRSNLPNQGTVAAVLTKGHLEIRVMAVWKAWGYRGRCIGYKDQQSLQCQRTAQVPASDPKPHWWDVNRNNLLPLITLFFSCFQLTRYSVITERKREQEAENIPLEHQHRSGQIFLVSICLSNLSHVAWCFNDLRVCKSLRSDSCKWEFRRFH